MKSFVGVVTTIALLLALLLTSVEIAVFSDLSFSDRAYMRYHVPQELAMETQDLHVLTEEMLRYLKGDRADLAIRTKVDQTERFFFNEKEMEHMKDVQALFLVGDGVRFAAVLICVAGFFFFWRTHQWRMLGLFLQRGTITFCLVGAILTFFISWQFNRAFILFHHIFFRNDLWLLDPKTDLLIRLVPQPFFSDMAARIGILFASGAAAVILVSSVLLKKTRGRR